MFSKTKRFLALILALSMLFSMMSMGVSATQVDDSAAEDTTEESGYPELVLDQTQSAIITDEENYGYFRFVPQEDGIYTFFSSNDSGDTFGALFDAEENSLADNDDDGEANNFSITTYLHQGKAYVLKVTFVDGSYGAIDVCVKKESASFSQLNLGERTSVFLDGENYTIAYLRFTAPKDGFYSFTSYADADTYGYLYDENFLLLEQNDDGGQHSNFLVGYYLEEGITYYFAARFYNIYNSGSFEVDITPANVTTVSIAPVELLPDTNCGAHYITDENGNQLWYSYYYWFDNMRGTVTFEDGTSTEFSGLSFEHNGRSYKFEFGDNQSYDERWLPGNTYDTTAILCGIETQVSVTILPSPVESVTLEHLDMPENWLGCQQYTWDDELGESVPSYYEYYWYDFVDGTITLKDGNTISITDGYYEYNGNYYEIQPYHYQNSENYWVLNNTYTPQTQVLGVTASASVAIKDTIISDISIAPIELQLNSNGYWVTDEETSQSYFRYNWADFIQGTVTFADGTQKELNSYSLSYGSNSYEAVCMDTQSFETPWLPGQTYLATINLFGYKADVSINIEDSPISSIHLDDISIIEGTCGDRLSHEGGDMYFHYNWRDYITGTVYFNDGTWAPVNGQGFYWNQEWYVFECSDGQEDSHWYTGNTYTLSVSVLGKVAPVNVTIAESPVANVSIDPMQIIVNTMGSWEQYQEPGSDTYEQYYYYHFWDHLSGTVYFKDGSEAPIKGTGFEYNGQNYHIYYDDTQYQSPWNAEETYEITFRIMNVETIGQISIINSPIASVTIEPINLTENSFGWTSERWDEDTQSHVPFFRYNWESRVKGTAIFTDGTSVPFQGMYFIYEDNTYDLICTDTQDVSPWSVNTTYTIPFEILGFNGSISVTIDPRPDPSTFLALQADREYGFTLSDNQPQVNATFTPDQDDLFNIRFECTEYTYVRLTTAEGEELVSESGNNFDISRHLTAGTMYVLEAYSENYGYISINVRACPISGIYVAPVTMFENSGGYWGSYWDEQNQTYVDAYRYNWDSYMRGTVFFKNGTSAEFSGTSFEHDGIYYHFDYDDPQSYMAWTPGNTYNANILCMGFPAGVSISIDTCPVESISLNPIVLEENTYGYPQENGSYWYHWYEKLSGTIYFNDGTSSPIEGNSFSYHGMYYNFDWIDPQGTSPWTAGNTYIVSLSAMGYAASVAVSIEQSALVNVVLNPITFLCQSGGYWDTIPHPITGQPYRYYHYEWQSRVSGTAFFRDGTSLPFSSDRIHYNGQFYDLTYNYDIQRINPWQPGNTYSFPMYVGNMTLTQYVTIEALPTVEELPALLENETQQVNIFEYGGKHLTTFTPTKTGLYIFESLGHLDTFGAIYDANWNLLEENDDAGQNSNFSISINLTAGQTYILESRFLYEGTSGGFTIRISPSAIASISINPISIIEHTCGGKESYWDEALQMQVEYFMYYWADCMEGTVTFVDGTTQSFYGSYFYHNGNYYQFSTYDQQPDSHWYKDGVYTVSVECQGVTATTTVSITASELDRIEVDAMFIPEFTGGYYTSEFVDNFYREYYRYSEWQNQITGTAYFKDGSSCPIEYSSFLYDDLYFTFSFDDPQNSQNVWLAGNTYAVTLTTMGVSTELIINICTPITGDGYRYIVQNGKVIISDCMLTDKSLLIPEAIDGLPVVGIVSLGDAMSYCEDLSIPDSVSMLSMDLFEYYNAPLKSLYLGAGVRSLNANSIHALSNLEYIKVSENNPILESIDGVLYDEDITMLVGLPPAYSTTYLVPDSVTDLDMLLYFPDVYALVKYLPGAGTPGLTVIDGVVYNTAVTTVYSISKERTGELVLPNTVTEIRSHALAGSSLESVTIPDTVTEIAYGTFYQSTSLENVNMPHSIENIYMSAFQDCSSLKSINIPSNCNYVANSAFSGCTALEAVHIQDLDAWCHTVFGGNGSNPLLYAKNLYLNGQLLTDLVIPETVGSTVYNFAFTGINVNTITVPESVYSIGAYAFEFTNATQVNLPEKLQFIDTGAFAHSNLSSVTLPDSLVMAGNNCFTYSGLKSAEIGSNLAVISSGMFMGTPLKQITIPATVQYIGSVAFADCHYLNEVIFEGSTIEIGDGAFAQTAIRSMDLPAHGFMSTWETFRNTELATMQIPDTVTELMYGTFADCDNLMSVVIPSSVQFINSNAFEGCNSLGHVLYEGSSVEIAKMENYSMELGAAAWHFDAKAEDITVNYYCHQIQHYCAICNEWEYIDLGGSHDFVDGVCVTCGYNEFSAFVDGESYKTLEEAIDAAPEGTTIELNNNIVTDSLTLNSGAQLDLNGATLIVSDGLVVFDGEIVDSSEGEAALVIEKDALVISETNTQMPLYNTETGSYHFYSYSVSVKGVRENPDGSVTYGFRFDFGGHSAYELLAETEASGMAGMFFLSWPGSDRMDFSFGDDLIRQYAQLSEQYGDMAALMVTITGLETLDPGTELTAYAGIYSDKGIYKTGENMSFTTTAE